MIMTSSTVAAALALAGTQNNPVIGALGVQATATSITSTGGGTELAPAANVVTGSTYDFWEQTANVSERANIQFVFPSLVSLDFMAIAAHNIGTIGADVRPQYSLNSGASWTNAGAGTAFPTDDGAIAFRFPTIVADYWRVRVENAGTNNVRIGVVMLGTEMILPSRIYQGYTPPVTPTRVDLQSNVSEGGHLLGSSVVRKSSTGAASMQHLPESFVRGSQWLAFQKAFNDGAGFFWGWRPEKYGDLFYAWRSGQPLIPTNSGPKDFMSAEMQMRFFDAP